MRTAPPVTDDLVREVATEAGDPRSVTRVLAGLPVRGRAGERIRRALEARGITLPDPNAPRDAA
jgi:hypothetical protein